MKDQPRRRFAFRLALRLGIFDVNRFLATITPEQLDEWADFYELEPWGDEWRQMATLAAVVQNMLAALAAALPGAPKIDFLDVDDFVPCPKQPEPELCFDLGSAAQQTAAVRALAGF